MAATSPHDWRQADIKHVPRDDGDPADISAYNTKLPRMLLSDDVRTGKQGGKRSWGSWGLVGLVSLLLTVAFIAPETPRAVFAPSSYPALVSRLFLSKTQGRAAEEAPAVTSKDAYSSNGRTAFVQWDQYSLLLAGHRILIYSGEFHTFRLPVPSLWLDILQKVKAAGLNAVSVYTHWGLINPSPGVIDFDSFRALQPLFDAASAAGIWVVLRPGPYINAETTAGGIAHWVTSQVAGTLRTNASDYEASWQDYIQGIIAQTAPNQISVNGPVIGVQVDNEYFQSGFGNAEYFAELEAAYHNSSIVVPLTYNDPGEGKNFVNGTGAVDIYGLDSYPQGFDCSHPETWSPVVTNYHDYHEGKLPTNPSQPFYFPEFQGGSFDAWGPTAPGYANCRELTGPSFLSVFYRTLWAANAKLMSFYMLYGGTSWGGIPFPGVYTSYDYGSAIQENRDITTKFTELKSQGLFLRSSPDFYKTDWIGNSSTGVVQVSNSAAFVVQLKNPDTGASFWIARQTDSTSNAITSFTLNVTTKEGTFKIPQTVPNITLSGRQSKVIVTDYSYGQNGYITWSTTPILFAGRIGTRDVLFLYGDSNQGSEIALKHASPDFGFPGGNNIHGGPFELLDTSTDLITYTDTDTAGTFFSPVIPAPPGAIQPNYWEVGTVSSVLVGGPHLVRNASFSSIGVLELRGDLNASTRLVVIGPLTMTGVTWNGVAVANNASAAAAISRVGGVWVGQLTLSPTAATITAPALTGWKFKDNLPEIQAGFDDSSWTVANHTTTNIPAKPLFGDGRVLYGCDYGFCENVVLWRGHFSSTGTEKSVNLSINGGEAFAASVWLNNVFLGTSFGNSTNNANSVDEVNQQFAFPDGSLVSGGDNVITIVQDNMGLDESGSTTNTIKSSRGVRGFQLNNGTFGAWKVQGKIGGYTGFPDKTRGVLNEGGLFAERAGWHLPGFDTSSWTSREFSSGLPNNTAGVGFFVKTFKLDVPAGFDVLMSFTFDDSSQPYRALLFVNGWMMGKRVANLGPQFKFPVHEGILNYQGENTVAVALWAMESVAISPTLDLTIDTVLQGGVGGVTTNNPVWSSTGRTPS
ncbi:glycoside hydrolase family 35 protein [Auriscalpium vulgare]|uniref:Glycoside hydrolase family 35 protein n=1 Tax=Auriscalpium vulgare TaxID=40419 RepID=A0ACB8RAN7_9AGAM|nr:glycoside hydrolase family 35 protein [Auriscalpium vulgare]